MERYARGHCRSSGRVEAAEGNSGRQGGVDWGYSARNKLVHPSNAQKSDRLTRVVEACTVAVAAREGVNHVNGWGRPAALSPFHLGAPRCRSALSTPLAFQQKLTWFVIGSRNRLMPCGPGVPNVAG
jgi:hypothetical protein